MEQAIKSLSFFERFQHPVTRRAALTAFCGALAAAVLAVAPSFLKSVLPQLAGAQPIGGPKQTKLAAKQEAPMVHRRGGS